MSIQTFTAGSDYVWYNGHTYLIIGSPTVASEPGLNWADAKQTALAINPHFSYLAEINSAAENEVIYQLAVSHNNRYTSAYIAPDAGGAKYVWLGASNLSADLSTVTAWKWDQSGQVIPNRLDGNLSLGGSIYQNWGKGSLGSEPDNFQGQQHVLAMGIEPWPQPNGGIGTAGQWNDIKISDRLPYVVEINAIQQLLTQGATLTGTTSNDLIIGNIGNDIINADAGDDIISGDGGQDKIDGGLGANTVLYSGKLAEYTIKSVGNGVYTVADNVSNRDGTDTLTNIQRLGFSDVTKSISDIVNAGNGSILFSNSSNPIPSNAPSSATSIFATNLDASGNAFGYYSDNANHIYGFTIANGSFQSINVPNSNLTKVTGTIGSNICGFYYDSAGTSHGFLKNQSQITIADNPSGFYGTWLTVGNATQAAGAYCDASGQLHGYIQTFSNAGSQFTTINDPLGTKGTWVTGLSSDGKAAGFYIDSSNTYHGFTYQGGNFANINVTSSVHTIPIGINSSGQVVGEYMDANSHWHGFLYSNGTFTPYDYANASLTAFTGINDSGNIVGIATVGTSTQSFGTHIL